MSATSVVVHIAKFRCKAKLGRNRSIADSKQAACHSIWLGGVAMIDRCHCEQSEFFKGAAQPRQTVAVAESEDWAMALVAAGVGVAIVPEGVARAHPDVVVRAIDVDVKRQVGLAYSAARPPSDALQKLIASVRKQRPVSGRSGRRAAIARPAKWRAEVKLKRQV
jgi:DNA-binding transcriptional LysR family regulator